jgi:hypothetical protein
MIAAMIFAAAVQANALSPGCADHWQVALGEESFANNGAGVSFSPAELGAFRTGVEAALKRAIGEACTNAAIEPELAGSVSQVTVLSASGASEPHLYLAGDGSLVLEWVFAEEALALPSDPDIVAGTACWANPEGEACVATGD